VLRRTEVSQSIDVKGHSHRYCHVRAIVRYPKAPVHPTVRERFKLEIVTQATGPGPYRPDALTNHDDFKSYYPTPLIEPSISAS
jgi:hypothetical protein